MVDDYLELLKRVLTGSVFPESADQPMRPTTDPSPRAIIRNFIINIAAKKNIRLVKCGRYDVAAREEGRDWPSIAYTMIGMKRLNNVQHSIEIALSQKILGDIVECGVWRGGCAIFMRAVLNAHNISDRTIWAVDSFEGLPRPDAPKYPADQGYDLSQSDYLSVPLEVVRGNFDRFGLLDHQVQFLRGWFKDTLPTAPIAKIAVLRADGDLYESTLDILNNLYDKVSPGGFVIIDDYYSWQPCNRAVTEFRASRGITAPIETVDWTGAYWRVPESQESALLKSA
ncbi:MAG: TylF/MycF family methyltransferase [Pseudonocardiaceae bacterium]